jgi:scyllo-inositol 2-dehydrogenase (NADP+)
VTGAEHAPIGVGLVGYGTSGADLHAPLITADPRLRLRAVVSGRPERVHRDLPTTPVVPDLAHVLDDPEVELVVVAAPNDVHHELARAALLADRHVVVDKPFTLSTAQADDLIATAARQDRRLSVFHQRRWDADYRTVRHCVQAGVLGRVTTYIARYDRFRPTVDARDGPRPGAGVLYDLGPHLIDQALHLFGLPDDVLADVTAQRAGSDADDYVHLVLRYGPLRVVLHAGSLVHEPGPRFEVHGDAGTLVTRGRDGQIAARPTTWSSRSAPTSPGSGWPGGSPASRARTRRSTGTWQRRCAATAPFRSTPRRPGTRSGSSSWRGGAASRNGRSPSGHRVPRGRPRRRPVLRRRSLR